MQEVSIMIGGNFNALSEEDLAQVEAALKKIGFSHVGYGGGEFDVELTLTGPNLRVDTFEVPEVQTA